MAKPSKHMITVRKSSSEWVKGGKLKTHPKYPDWQYNVYWSDHNKGFMQFVRNNDGSFSEYYRSASFWEWLVYKLL